MAGVIPNIPRDGDLDPTAAETSMELQSFSRFHGRMVDTFTYDYGHLVRDDKRPFARVPAGSNQTVAIVGTGFAAWTAAHELVRAGVKKEHITLYEARRDRTGGRAWTHTFQHGGHAYPCEMGPMRVPENSTLFWHYLLELTKQPSAKIHPFPNPGVVPTLVLYQDETSSPWIGSPPEGSVWRQIQKDVAGFFNNLRAGGEPLSLIKGLLKKKELSTEDRHKIHRFWADALKKYDAVSFIQALTGPGAPSWDPHHIDRFATSGMGTGGFGPLFPVSFLELLRLWLWDYATEYAPHITMSDFIDLFEKSVSPVVVRERVRYVGRSADGKQALVFTEGAAKPAAHDYVIVATTLRSMQLTMNLDGARPPQGLEGVVPPFDDRVRQAIRTAHIVSTSKLFGFLPDKPWDQDEKWPRLPDGRPVKCLLTDTLARAVYFLEHEGKPGVTVLVSYNWGDDAIIHQAVPTEAELKRAYQVGLETANVEGLPLAKGIAGIADDHLKRVQWQIEPMIFGGFKLAYPAQYRHTTRVVYQYQTPEQRVFLANNNCSYQDGWIEGAMQSGVNAAAAVLRGMGAPEFRMAPLFAGNPFTEVAAHLEALAAV